MNKNKRNQNQNEEEEKKSDYQKKKGTQSAKNVLKPSMPKQSDPFKDTVIITQRAKTKFEDQYDILCKLGTPGAFGQAYRVQEKSTKKFYAAKEISKAKIYRLHPMGKPRKRLVTSLAGEIQIMRTLNHPYIVKLHDSHETKHALRIVMEECKGGELFERIKERKKYKEEDAKPIIRMILEALSCMHNKHRICHLDLKPDNIMFVDKSENSDIKIIDFGMSQVLPRLQSLRHLCGTPYYTAPEIISGEYSHPADLWSVGVITYVMIIGHPPFYVDPTKYCGMEETRAIFKLILKGFDPKIKKGYGAHFPRPLANLLSSDGRDFIKYLLQTDIGKRMTANEALDHPWLNKNKKRKPSNPKTPDVDSSDEYDFEVNKNMALKCAGWATSNKFKFAISALFQEQFRNVRPKHFENLQQIFAKLDKNHDGVISYPEFEEGMIKAGMDKSKTIKMFKELAIGNEQGINFKNLLNAAVHDYLVESDVRLYEAFRDLDLADCGRIKTEDLKSAIRKLDMYDDDQLEYVYEIIDQTDMDKNGYIDYEEYLRALHPDFNEAPNWMISSNSLLRDDLSNNTHKKPKNKNSEASEDSTSVSLPSGDIIQPNDNENDSNTPNVGIPNPEEIAAFKSSDVYKTGWMHKQGKHMRNWKRRYFVLTYGGTMTYYVGDNQEHPKGIFSCRNLTKLSYKSWGKKTYGLKVYTQHRNWKLLLESEEERLDWHAAISYCSKFLSMQ